MRNGKWIRIEAVLLKDSGEKVPIHGGETWICNQCGFELGRFPKETDMFCLCCRARMDEDRNVVVEIPIEESELRKNMVRP
jgi:hypothetical protein